MPRADAMGFFWHDEPKIKKEAAQKIKREPPFPFWLQDNYLPGLEEAQHFDVPLFSDSDLVIACMKKERLVWDIECYPNYFLIAFKSIVSGKVICFEADNYMNFLDLPKLSWVLHNFTIISFNGIHYDAPIAAIALGGGKTEDMWHATSQIITMGERPHEVLKAMRVSQLKQINHIDLKEVAPLHDSLKIYSGRLHTRRMQDLPFKPGTILNRDQMDIVRYYCVNDLRSTEELYNELKPAIELRELMSVEYKIDLRSRSDAQVAEAVVLSGLKTLTGQKRFEKPSIKPGYNFNYQVPHYIKYQSPLLNTVLNEVSKAEFIVDLGGEIITPSCFPMEFDIANSSYKLGIGGLHSKEKNITYRSGNGWMLIDRDVASFYPRVILTQELFPEHLGRGFLKVYKTIVERRLAAKDKAANLKEIYKDKVMPAEILKKLADLNLVADSLKITINGSFGKFGNAYSMLYSPNLMIQVTLTGQLVLLMLIERLELAGITVVSANTDGIVIRCRETQKEKLNGIIKQWEIDIDCKTEETRYKSIHNRDVNNYFAIKEDGEIKVKGVYAEKGSAGNSILSKNPYALIVSDAVKKFLLDGTAVDHTIRECKDIRRFVCLRYAKKGAVKVYSKQGEENENAEPNEYLGKAIRWYYSTTVTGEIVNAVNGNKVSMTDGARPVMTLPDEMPKDINYQWYEDKANKILEEIGV
jgi:hypothetical protein